jgi:CheY-like chemotaxis protein
MTDSCSILAVDDESESLRLLTDTLVADGYKRCATSSGQLGLASVATWLPQLSPLDIRRLGIDGFKICRRLKAGEKTRNIPLLFISAARDNRTVRKHRRVDEERRRLAEVPATGHDG